MKGIRKILVLSMAVVMLMTMVGVGASAVETEETPNLVVGGAFDEFPEEAPAGWNEYVNTVAPVNRRNFTSVITSSPERGNYLNLVNTSGDVTYKLSGLTDGESYVFSFVYNAVECTPKVQIKLSYPDPMDGVKYRQVPINKKLDATTGWKSVSEKFVYSESATDTDPHIIISLAGVSTSTVSYDDICIRTLTEEEKTNLVPYGNMETIENGKIFGFTATSGSLAIEENDTYSGNYSLKITSNTNWNSNTIAFPAGNYKMTFYTKGEAVQIDIKNGMGSGTLMKTIWDDYGKETPSSKRWTYFPVLGPAHIAACAYTDGGADVWQEKTLYFTVPEGGFTTTLSFSAPYASESQPFYMDDLSIVPEAASVGFYNKYTAMSGSNTEYGYQKLRTLSEVAAGKTVIKGYLPSVKTGEAPILLACFYKKVNNENSLVDVQVISSEAATEAGYMFLEGAITVPQDAEYAKALVWNSASGLAPLCKTFRIN